MMIIVMREREGKAGGGKGFLLAENRSFTLATSNFQIIFYGQRVGDVRVQDDKINTLQARMGTGGNNMPMVAEVLAFDTFNQTVSDKSQTIKSHSANNENIGTVLIPDEPMSVDIYNATIDKDVTHTLKAANQPMGVPSVLTSTVRRLTPTECERLQGFPDGWTEGQADSHRYKQMGNAVAVPVVQWIINRLTN
jgi:DNA (cytosine-5)-methyltransferase 1